MLLVAVSIRLGFVSHIYNKKYQVFGLNSA